MINTDEEKNIPLVRRMSWKWYTKNILVMSEEALGKLTKTACFRIGYHAGFIQSRALLKKKIREESCLGTGTAHSILTALIAEIEKV